MAAKSDSDSSSSSSSSSLADGEESIGGSNNLLLDISANDVVEEAQHNDVDATTVEVEHEVQENDICKVFLSRIPQTFNEESITRIFDELFGKDCVVEVSIVKKSEEDNEGSKPSSSGRDNKTSGVEDHRGFGFVTFATITQRNAAIDAGTIKGSAKSNSKRKHTLYIRPVVRNDDEEGGGAENNTNTGGSNGGICFLWQQHRCPYGNECKFVHDGDGGFLEKKVKKKQKCFAFKKSGKCKLGDECPYSHETTGNKTAESKGDVISEGKGDKNKKKDKSQTNCINWKNKGKCRKGDKCPYLHDESVREKVLAKKKGKDDTANLSSNTETKERHPLSIRVFGLNYETTEKDIRSFFEHCGPIVEVTFPTFEDSGRSKGYCGVLFQSPKATEKAVAMDGNELHGRWLQIQAGKMYLRKWEEVENGRKRDYQDDDKKPSVVGEYGQPVKKRKQHGFKD